MPKVTPIVTAYVLMDDETRGGISSIDEQVSDEDKKEVFIKNVFDGLRLAGIVD